MRSLFRVRTPPGPLEDFAAALGSVVERFPPRPTGLVDSSFSSGNVFIPFFKMETVHLKKGNFTAGKYVSEDRPGLWGWVIFPPNLRCPKMMHLAKLQAWTLKPAVLLQPDRSKGGN
jgi:hypothetical protein